jgi:putative flavoprotein involved in K+ transport
MREDPVVIIGGGASGLSSAAALKRAGIASVVLDADRSIGNSWARRYERLHLHSVRQFSGLAHFAMSARLPKYVTKDQYAEYLQEYARHFALDVELECAAQRVRLDPDSDPRQPSFLVETEHGVRRARDVVIATGMYRKPEVPAFPGLDVYGGVARHTADYVRGSEYAGKRVLVVGIGNTGAEIAADLAEQGAAFVAISVRSTPPIVPRDFFGRPIQASGILLSLLPASVADAIGRVIVRVTFGDSKRYGIGDPDWMPFASKRTPVIDVGFVASLRKGRIVVRPNIARFTSDGVVFVDGRAETYDAVLFATGYTTGLDSLVDIPGVLDTSAYPFARSGEPTAQPGLYFMGFLRSNRGHLFETNIDSRRLARHISATPQPHRE